MSTSGTINFRLYELYGHVHSLFVLCGDETAERLHEGLEWPNTDKQEGFVLHYNDGKVSLMRVCVYPTPMYCIRKDVGFKMSAFEMFLTRCLCSAPIALLDCRTHSTSQ